MLTIAYDGSAYCGFQVQKNGITVQEVINEALSSWLGEDIKIIAASRTDAGVHARGNVAVFDTETRIPGEKYAYGLNTGLPEDIRIQGSKEVPADFHPRFAQTIKTYKYRILNRRFPDPLLRTGYWFSYFEYDTDAMKSAAADLIGEHDFTSFASPARETTTSIRTIYDASVEKQGDIITFSITGNGFLYNMVRIIAGTLTEIGKGALAPDCIPEILNAKDRSAAGPTAPAGGLTLESIRYPEYGF